MTDVPGFDYWQVTPATEPPFDLGTALDPDRDWPHEKLYGERWGHFGAFASEEGRRWDWLWGRIDAGLTLSRQIMVDTGVTADEMAQLQHALVNAILAEEGQSEEEVKKHAECMHDLSQKELWHRYAIEASPPTRRSLSRIAAELTGTVVPKSWPYAVHALADTQRLWKEHGPDSDLRRASLAGYRAIGLTARTIALLRVKALLKGKLGKQRRRPVDSAAQDGRDLQR